MFVLVAATTSAAALPPGATSAGFECTSAEYCPASCPAPALSAAVPMVGSTRLLMGNSTGERQLHAAVTRMVGAVTQRFGNVTNDMSGGLHLSFQYLCCYNRTELARVEAAMASVAWEPVRVSFRRLVCAASMVLALVDPAAQGALFAVVSAIEEAMAAAGIGARFRLRAEQAPFHASLFSASVGAGQKQNETARMSDVVAVAQSTVPKGGSLNAVPIVVDSFTFNGKTFRARAPGQSRVAGRGRGP